MLDFGMPNMLETEHEVEVVNEDEIMVEGLFNLTQSLVDFVSFDTLLKLQLDAFGSRDIAILSSTPHMIVLNANPTMDI